VTEGKAERKSAVATRRGDDGTTGLLFGSERVFKDEPRTEAYGAIDEAIAALGLARAEAGLTTQFGSLPRTIAGLPELILRLQRELFVVGAELATAPDAISRQKPGETRVTAAMVAGLDEVLAGYPVDFLLYANNYEPLGEGRAVLDRFPDLESALEVFSAGRAMSKGTTSETGLTGSYFANPFGAPQFRELHEGIARRTFEAAFASGVYVGQIRTRLALPGQESQGPAAVAKALLEVLGT